MDHRIVVEERLQQAVAAKLKYWEALDALENALSQTPLTDSQSDKLVDFVDNLAAASPVACTSETVGQHIKLDRHVIDALNRIAGTKL